MPDGSDAEFHHVFARKSAHVDADSLSDVDQVESSEMITSADGALSSFTPKAVNDLFSNILHKSKESTSLAQQTATAGFGIMGDVQSMTSDDSSKLKKVKSGASLVHHSATFSKSMVLLFLIWSHKLIKIQCLHLFFAPQEHLPDNGDSIHSAVQHSTSISRKSLNGIQQADNFGSPFEDNVVEVTTSIAPGHKKRVIKKHKAFGKLKRTTFVATRQSIDSTEDMDKLMNRKTGKIKKGKSTLRLGKNSAKAAKRPSDIQAALRDLEEA